MYQTSMKLIRERQKYPIPAIFQLQIPLFHGRIETWWNRPGVRPALIPSQRGDGMLVFLSQRGLLAKRGKG